jgi:hypothetical protein
MLRSHWRQHRNLPDLSRRDVWGWVAYWSAERHWHPLRRYVWRVAMRWRQWIHLLRRLVEGNGGILLREGTHGIIVCRREVAGDASRFSGLVGEIHIVEIFFIENSSSLILGINIVKNISFLDF